MPENADMEDVLFQRGLHPLLHNVHPDPFYEPAPDEPRVTNAPRFYAVPPYSDSSGVSVNDAFEGDSYGHAPAPESEHEEDSWPASVLDNMNDDHLRGFYETHPDSD